MAKSFLSLELRQTMLRYFEAGYGYRSVAKLCCIKLDTAKTARDIWRRGDLGYFGESSYVLKSYYPTSFKIEAVETYLAKGGPIKTYCRERNLSPTTFRGWLKRYEQKLLV